MECEYIRTYAHTYIGLYVRIFRMHMYIGVVYVSNQPAFQSYNPREQEVRTVSLVLGTMLNTVIAHYNEILNDMMYCYVYTVHTYFVWYIPLYCICTAT